MQLTAKLNGQTGDVVVIFVHGINVTCQDYYEPMRDRILRLRAWQPVEKCQRPRQRE